MAVQLGNSTSRYGLIHKLLHAVAAPLVIGVYILGLWMNDLSYYSPYYQSAPLTHSSLASMVTVLILARLSWKLWQPSVLPLPSYSRFERLAAKLAHGAIYVLIFVLAITAYLFSTAQGDPLRLWFDIEIPSLGGRDIDSAWVDWLGRIHELAAHALALLIILHVIGVIKHHFFDKDKTFSRMFFGRK